MPILVPERKPLLVKGLRILCVACFYTVEKRFQKTEGRFMPLVYKKKRFVDCAEEDLPFGED